jgi:hypothetical protein
VDQCAVAEPGDPAIHHDAVAVGAARRDAVLTRAVKDLHLELEATRVRVIQPSGTVMDEALFHHHLLARMKRCSIIA